MAAYGAYKTREIVRDKNLQIRMDQARKYVNDYTKSGTYKNFRGMRTEELIKNNSGYSKLVKDTYEKYGRMADNDSFGTAAKNVGSNQYRAIRSKIKNRRR